MKAVKTAAPKKSAKAPSYAKKAGPIEFNPNANYSWKANDVLNMAGGDLHILHNTMQNIFERGMPEAQMYVALSKCYEITNGLLQRGVIEGKIAQEAKPQQGTQN